MHNLLASDVPSYHIKAAVLVYVRTNVRLGYFICSTFLELWLDLTIRRWRNNGALDPRYVGLLRMIDL